MTPSSVRGGVRKAWRALRAVPVVGGVVRAADRVVWARTILRSSLVDAEFYAAQRGWARADARRAVADYVARGFRHGFSLNPLFDELVAGRALPEPDRVPALYAYLVSDRRTVSVHPWWDARSGVEADGPAPLDRVWAERADATVRLEVGGREREVSVPELRRWAIDAARAWRRGSAPSPPERADVVIRLVQRRDRDYPRRVASAAQLSETDAVVVGFVGGEAGQWIGIDVASRLFPDLVWHRVPASAAYASAVAACVPALAGEARSVCVVGPRSDLTVAEVRRLQAGVRPGRAVGPVEIAPDGTVAAVGMAGTGTGAPYAILHGHPQEDLKALGSVELAVPLLAGPTFAVSADDWTRVGGFSQLSGGPTVPALCVALRSANSEFSCHVDTAILSTAYARHEVFRGRSGRVARFADDRREAQRTLDAAGFDVLGWRPSESRAHSTTSLVPELRWRRPEPDALRWALKICSPPGPLGAVWGDTHFAHGLAKALRRQGQFVAVDSFDARARPSSILDDVTLVVRGPYQIAPPTNGVRIEWIISHPDQITADEVAEFDLVYAASHRWSAAATTRWGRPVVPMLECTDADQFFPRGLERTDEIVFVGTARGIARPSVVVPLAAGIPVRVYGPDWRTFIPASAIAAESIPNADLSARYESASVVLNDQWPAMQKEGFIAMRPFDVVAAGGRVISEDVDGLTEVFGDAVPVFRTDAELLDLLARDPDELFPDADGLAAASDRIRRDHSFDARAGTLLSDVRRTRSTGLQQSGG